MVWVGVTSPQFRGLTWGEEAGGMPGRRELPERQGGDLGLRREDMYGFRARIGYIHPSRVNETTPYQFYRILPPGSGVTMASIHLGTREVTLAELDRVRDGLVMAAQALADSGVDIILQSGVPVVVSRGVGYEQEIVRAITETTGLPALTDIGCAVMALRHLGARTVAVGTPFAENINELVREYLEDSGFQVLAIKGLSWTDTRRVLAVAGASLPLAASYGLALEVHRLAPQSDALYVAGSPMPFVENIAPLERELGKPVVGALAAGIWASLRTLDIKMRVTGFGCLLESLA